MCAVRVRCSGDLQSFPPAQPELLHRDDPHEYSERAYEVVEVSQWIAGGESCGSLHLAAQEGVQSRPPEARALDRTQRSIRHTHNPAGEEHAMWTEPAEEVHASSREK